MKTLNEILTKAPKMKGSTVENPTVDHVKPKGEKEFVKKHVVNKTEDPAGNCDKVFNASDVKTTHLPGVRHGYSDAEDDRAYESVSDDEVLNLFSEEALDEAHEHASDHYKGRHADVMSHLDNIKDAVKQHRERTKEHGPDWGHVGDLNHVADRLREIHDFIGQQVPPKPVKQKLLKFSR